MSTMTIKYMVCPACDGEGFTSRLGDFTTADVDDWYGDDGEARADFTAEYTKRGGAYDEPCHLCKANRVVTPEQAEDYQGYLEMEAERAAEIRMGC